MFCGKAYYLRTSLIFVLLFLLYLLSVLCLYIHSVVLSFVLYQCVFVLLVGARSVSSF